MLGLAIVAALLLAQADAAPAWTLEAVAKVGLGVASFVLVCFMVRWLLVELRESRIAFLVALDKQHADHAFEQNRIIEHNSAQVRGLHERLDEGFAELRASISGTNTNGSADRRSRG